ncbi:MAG: type II toxin-antitoxin system VapC family toxin [Nanoarchaeota archaeon]
MIKLLLDTDYLIDYFRDQRDATLLIQDIRKRRIEGYLSVMSLYELYIGVAGYPDEKERISEIQTLKNWFLTLTLGEQTMYKAAQIRAYLKTINRTIEVRDLFIATTAILKNIPLKTRNKKDFRYIPELKLA